MTAKDPGLLVNGKETRLLVPGSDTTGQNLLLLVYAVL